MSHNNSTKAVIAALIGNVIIAIFKFVAAFFTKSASMLAEAIHSTADCLNQVFLLIGSKRSKKESDERHPFGYGREEYFWAFMVAILLFFVGAIFSVYEGIHKLSDPQPIQFFWWAIGILSASAVIEAKTFSVAYKEFRKTSKGNMYKAIKESIDINLIVILLEDSAALMGLLIALLCTVLSLINPIFDAIGSIFIGLLLSYVAVSLVNELRKLIIGESMPREDRNGIKDVIKDFAIVKHINRIKTMTMGKNQYLLLLSIDIEDFTASYNVEDSVEHIKLHIRDKYPQVNEIFIEISES